MVLEMSQARVRYRNGALGVLDVSLRVERGQVVALFGPNGAGKTTTIRAVSGFLRSEGARIVSGSISLLGRDVTNLEPAQTARLGVAVVPERRKVFPNLTVGDNLAAIGKRQSRRARAAGRERVFELFPTLAERRRELAGRLSGGQQQMLAIARALIIDPQLLIVDEMTLGLHHSMHQPLFDIVGRIASEGTSILIIDESAGFALAAADYCYLITSGVVRDEGPPAKFAGNELLAAGYVDAS
jgi:branched-chain amino acid transport system ATP-binding protein